MINELLIENFKTFATPQSVPLNRITLLYGPNSAGKSSVIQALLLLKQTLEQAESRETVLLPKGRWVDLGSFPELVHRHDLDRASDWVFDSAQSRTLP